MNRDQQVLKLTEEYLIEQMKDIQQAFEREAKEMAKAIDNAIKMNDRDFYPGSSVGYPVSGEAKMMVEKIKNFAYKLDTTRLLLSAVEYQTLRQRIESENNA